MNKTLAAKLPGFLLLLGLATVGAFGQTASARMRLEVDATEVPRGIFHARMTISARPGAMTLVYPKWIPGEHMPTGPITNLVGLRFSAGGRPVAWTRDLVDMYAFHLDVPAGATALDVALDYVPASADQRFSSGDSTTPVLAVLNWNQVVLYPEGDDPSALECEASLRVPEGWKVGTALPLARSAGSTFEFAPAALATLIDSPAVMGEHYRSIDLSPGQSPPHEVDMVADSQAALEMPSDWIDGLRQLVSETGALFGARHYRDYHFLLTLSDGVAGFGLEHHESSDDRSGERTLIDPDRRKVEANLLPHELVHSWNGKYRRPADLATTDYQQPMKDDLLWVYEGLTQYLGDVLTARSGLLTPEDLREELARLAAILDHTPGRTWRPLADTAVAAQLLYGAPGAWASWRRETDFYDEGLLIWLEADARIRKETGGKRSLDDFCRRFHGGTSGPPAVKTYTLDDVINGLNEVAPADWRSFLAERLESTKPGAPLHGIEASGWRLVYNDTPNEMVKAHEAVDKEIDLRYSLGALIKEDGTLADVLPGMPAAMAGLAPGMRLVAVGGRKWRAEGIREALRAAKGVAAPIELLAENSEFYRTYAVVDHDGEKFPHLERIPGVPDLLGEITRPRAPKPKR